MTHPVGICSVFYARDEIQELKNVRNVAIFLFFFFGFIIGKKILIHTFLRDYLIFCKYVFYEMVFSEFKPDMEIGCTFLHDRNSSMFPEEKPFFSYFFSPFYNVHLRTFARNTRLL